MERLRKSYLVPKNELNLTCSAFSSRTGVGSSEDAQLDVIRNPKL